jgi:glycosyltransferase involved in cell wall biosynthesis
MPFVAIWMLTYNHKQYIAQAIEGALSQKTNFSYRIYLGEDCSTDGTREICQKYANDHPDKLELFLNSSNDIKRNAKTIYDACFNSGAKYIAMCEGDDYWTDPDKLQTQVDFLEQNPDFASCFHNTVEEVENDPAKSFLYCSPSQPEICSTIDLLSQGNIVPTCSNVFRREHLPSLPKWVPSLGMGDWPLNVLLSKAGKIRYVNRVMGVHRIHGMGIWSKSSAIQKERAVLKAYEAFSRHLTLTEAEKEIVNRKVSGLIAAIVAGNASTVGRLAGLKFLLRSILEHPGFLFGKDFLRCGRILLG